MNFTRPGSLKAAERVTFLEISKSQKAQKEGFLVTYQSL